MKRIEIYIDRNDQLTVEIYKNEKDTKSERIFRGRESYKIIEKICNGKIRNVTNLNPKDITLHYSDYYIDIFYYEHVLKKLGTTPIKEDLNVFYHMDNIKKIKKKKVKRKNKYIKKRIITTTLGVILLSSVAATNISSIGAAKESDIPKTSTEKIVEDETDENINDVVLKEEQKVNIETIEVEEKKELDEVVVSISYDDRSHTEKATITKSYYGDLIEKYSKQYGLDPKIVIGIATQERGVHSGVKDAGGATGLMQIQVGVWRNQPLTAFNYNTNSKETIVVNEGMLSDVDYNVKVGCMIFQNNIKEMKNNMLAAIQCYNLGSNNMRKILNAYSNNTGRSIDTILADINDNGWLEYRDILGIGDPEYVEHVCSWIGDEVTINNVENNGNIVNLSINNKSETKNVSIN